MWTIHVAPGADGIKRCVNIGEDSESSRWQRSRAELPNTGAIGFGEQRLVRILRVHAECAGGSGVAEAVARRVGETTLRDAADEIGMSFSGLASFLRGGSPQKKTLTKLVAWFYQRTAHASAPPRDELEVALAQLIVYVQDQSKPRNVRDRRLEEIIERLKE